MARHVPHNDNLSNNDGLKFGFCRGCGGFSLIEMLIALVILSVSIFALTSVTLTSMRVNNQNDFRNTAIRLTSETAENLLAQSIDALADGTHSNTIQIKIRGITQTYTINNTVSTLTNDLRQISINVQYTFMGHQYSNNAVIYKHRAV